MSDWRREIERRGLAAGRPARAEELAQHLEDRYRDLRARGLDEAEARQRTLAEIGADPPPPPARAAAWLRDFARDLRFGARMLRRAPVFTLAAVLTLALGIGAGTAVFSMVDALVLRPFPVRDPGRLAVLAFRQGNGPLLTPFSIADARDIRAQTTAVFDGIAGYQFGIDGLAYHGRAQRVLTQYVTGNYFSLLGLRPAAGRLIAPGEGRTPGANPEIVLGYAYWRQRFAGDRAIVGQTVELNGHPLTVIGIAPAGFEGMNRLMGAQAFLPLGMLTLEPFPPNFMVNRILQNLLLVARVRPGVSLAQAAGALRVVGDRLARAYPETDKGLRLSVYWNQQAQPDPGNAPILRRAGALFLGLVGLVLLLACANVANLLLVRAAARAPEMAVRAALGAGRARLLRQWLAESLVLALAAGAGGLAAGVWASRAAQAAIASTGLPMRLDFGLDGRVFAFAFACVLAVALGVGLAPALRASAARSALQPAGRRVTAGRHPLRTALVVGELSAALMLLILAGLFVRSLGRVQSVNLGFNPHHLVNLTVDPVEIGFHRTQGLKFYHALLARVRAAPGVEAAALSSAVPLGYYANNDYLHIAGYTNPPGRGLPLVFYSVISPGYFHTLQIPIVRGRAFTSQDARGAAWVAIVNQAFAAKYWPGRDPIGQSFAKVSGAVNPRYRVVGVAANSRFLSLTGPHRPRFFLPLAQNYPLATQQTLQVRTALPPELAIGQLVRTVHALQPGLPVFDTGTMSRGLDTLQGYLLFRVGAGAAAALGGLGLILAVVGIYGVVSYSVSQRRHEVGVRMALGAQPADIVRLLLRQGIAIVAVGTALGVPAAYALSRYAAALLVGVGRTDLAVYVGVTAALAAVALLASLVPAARATADPLTALRRD